MKTTYDNRALNGAYLKGRKAGLAFKRSGSKTACPYIDHRKADGRLTFSRAFRRAWFHGFDDGAK